MSGAVATPGTVTSGANREVCARACEKHGVTFNQSRTRESSGQQWGQWYPPECPQCAEETAERVIREQAQAEFDRDVLPVIKEEVIAETDTRCSEESGRENRLAALADRRMESVFLEWWAVNRQAFIDKEDSEDRARIDAEVIAARREQHIEQKRQALAQKQDELQASLEAEREEKVKESLAGWAL